MIAPLILLSALLWIALLVVPWRPYLVRETLADGPLPGNRTTDLSEVVVLIPARNESARIAGTLTAILGQGAGLKIVVVDDQSTDDTAAIVERFGQQNVVLIRGAALPPGWSGKVWAQAQAEVELDRPLTLLLDADIVLAPGLLCRLVEKMREQRAGLVSLMAELPMGRLREKLLIPAFVYFFKLLYPFSLSNAPRSRVAAAAGGCILVSTRLIHEIGGFAALRDALIDDCTFARLVKQTGARTWVGLTRSARSVRCYDDLADIWDMVARTAFTQLRYSIVLLSVCTLLMVLSFVLPLAALTLGDIEITVYSAVALCAMAISYFPTVHYYHLNPVWSFALPVAGLLFLAMTWTSAARHWWGKGAAWRDRHYGEQQ